MAFGIIAALTGPPKKKELEIPDIPNEKEMSDEEYCHLANRAGFAYAGIALQGRSSKKQSSALRLFLAKNGICVYDERKVYQYMDSITPFKHRWYWACVSANAHGEASYKKIIPPAALMTMTKIRDAYRDVMFEVSDITEIPKGDPFLRCSLDGKEWFIIERWDEPGFRM